VRTDANDVARVRDPTFERLFGDPAIVARRARPVGLTMLASARAQPSHLASPA